MREISLPEGVAVVGHSAFLGCRNLEEIVIPGSALALSDGLFSSCESLEEIVLPRHFQPTVDKLGIPASATIRYADVSTLTSPIPVSHAWLGNYPPLLAEWGDDFERAANAMAENGINQVWECYLAGIDPTDPSASFMSSLEMKGATPSLSWSPDLHEARSYAIFGKENLADPEWKPGPVAGQRFFQIKVSMPATEPTYGYDE